MAVVTIRITDDEETKGCYISAESDPPLALDSEDSDATPSQVTAAMIMKMLDAMVQQAQMEESGE